MMVLMFAGMSASGVELSSDETVLLPVCEEHRRAEGHVAVDGDYFLVKCESVGGAVVGEVSG